MPFITTSERALPAGERPFVRHLELVDPAGAARSPAAPPAPVLGVHLLGQLKVRVDDVAIQDWPSGRGRSVFKYLVTHRDPWPRPETLMAVFWPDAAPAAARNSLHVAVHGLRRAFRASAVGGQVVVLEGGAYRLDRRLRLWLDVEEFERHAAAGRRLEADGELAGAAAEYERAAALYQGDLLADDPYQDWPLLAREQLLLTHLEVLDRLSGLYFGRRQYGACVALCRLLVERDPCREDAHRRLMRCYTRQGQPHLALRQYQTCVDALDRELALGPDPATVALAQQVRHHQPV
jgi:DNA-binding SARP family transcriptional activator